MQAVHWPAELAAEHVSGMQAVPTWCWPVGHVKAVEGEAHTPLLGVMLVSAQLVHHPERGSKVLQEAATFWQLPLKNCLVPHAWAWIV